jgi:hypothetical protein
MREVDAGDELALHVTFDTILFYTIKPLNDAITSRQFYLSLGLRVIYAIDRYGPTYPALPLQGCVGYILLLSLQLL